MKTCVTCSQSKQNDDFRRGKGKPPFDDKTCIDMLEYAYNHGASVESLKNIAKTAKDLSSLKDEIWEAMG